MSRTRIGIDLGGTKIEALVLDGRGAELVRERVATPAGDYPATLQALADLVGRLEVRVGSECRVGIGMPGAFSRATGRVKNSNSVCLNGQPLRRDLEVMLQRPLRFANDADCFTLSEATDGAARGARSVFGVIIGTGTGGGVVIDGRYPLAAIRRLEPTVTDPTRTTLSDRFDQATLLSALTYAYAGILEPGAVEVADLHPARAPDRERHGLADHLGLEQLLEVLEDRFLGDQHAAREARAPGRVLDVRDIVGPHRDVGLSRGRARRNSAAPAPGPRRAAACGSRSCQAVRLVSTGWVMLIPLGSPVVPEV